MHGSIFVRQNDKSMANPHRAPGVVVINKRGSMWSLKKGAEGGQIRLLPLWHIQRPSTSLLSVFYPQALLCYCFCRLLSSGSLVSYIALLLVTSDMPRKSRRQSKSPVPPIMAEPPSNEGMETLFIQTQIGGGRQPSPPPIETPTRLRKRIKPTARDTGLVQQAGSRRAQLVEEQVSLAKAPDMDDSPGIITAIRIPPSSSEDHSDINSYIATCSFSSVDNSIIDPQLLTEPLSVSVPQARPEVVASTSFSTDSHESIDRSHTGIAQVIVPATQVISSTPSYVPAQPDAAPPTADSHESIDHVANGSVVIVPITRVIPPTPSHVSAQPDVAHSTSFTADSHESVDHVANGSVQVSIPVTRIIPPTPSRVLPLPTTADISTHAVPVPDDFNPPPQSSDSGDGPSTPTSGRRTGAVNAVLAAAYKQLEDVLSDTVEQTSLTAQQVVDGWHKSYGRVVNGINYWNRYASYLTKHEEQERRRGILAPDATITPTTRRRLYGKFKEDNPDTWQEILDLHDLLEASDFSPQTLAQRIQSFNKIRKRLVTILEGAAAKHGFETALVMCGKVVNEDNSLGFTHMTAGAKKFFELRCRADDNTIIGHLKAHVYNNVSLETVNEAFMDVDNREQSRDDMADLSVPRATPAPRADSSDPNKDTGYLTSIKDAFARLIQSGGGDTTKFKSGPFPWATLRSILASQGMVLEGWPSGVLMPGQLRIAGARTKGIADLSQAERRRLHQALINCDIKITKVNGKDARNALTDSLSPVIIGAPPIDSNISHAPCMYVRGRIENVGPACLSNLAATRVKRKAVAKGTMDDPLLIGSSEGSSPDVQIRPAKNFRATGTANDSQGPSMKCDYIELTSSDEVEEEPGRVIGADAGDHDYREPSRNGKRKANLLPASDSRVVKKHMSGKGKERDIGMKGSNGQGKRPKPRVIHRVIASSDSEVEVETSDLLTVRPIQRPHDGPSPSDRTVDPNTENVFVLPTAISSSSAQREDHVMFNVPEGRLHHIPAEPASPSPKRSQRALRDLIEPANSLVTGDSTAHGTTLPAHPPVSGSGIAVAPLPAQVSMQAPGHVAADSAPTTDTSVLSARTAESIPSLPPSSATPSISPQLTSIPPQHPARPTSIPPTLCPPTQALPVPPPPPPFATSRVSPQPTSIPPRLPPGPTSVPATLHPPSQAPPAPPQLPPKPALAREDIFPMDNVYVGPRDSVVHHQQTEWSDQHRQGIHPVSYRPSMQYYHYPGVDMGMRVPPQHGMGEMQRYDSGVYQEDFYRGDPRGSFGGFRAGGPGSYQGMRESLPPYTNRMDNFRLYHDVPNSQHVGQPSLRPTPSAESLQRHASHPPNPAEHDTPGS